MKKRYVTPLITFECLALSANIASGCAFLGTNSAEYVCPVVDEESGWTIFSHTTLCMMLPGKDDSICYDIPLINSNVFDS